LKSVGNVKMGQILESICLPFGQIARIIMQKYHYRTRPLVPASSPLRATRADAPTSRRRPLPRSPTPRRRRSRPSEARVAREDGGGGATSSPFPTSGGRDCYWPEGDAAGRAVAAPARPDPVAAGPDLAPVCGSLTTTYLCIVNSLEPHHIFFSY